MTWHRLAPGGTAMARRWMSRVPVVTMPVVLTLASAACSSAGCSQRKTRAQWTKTVTRMQSHGLKVYLTRRDGGS